MASRRNGSWTRMEKFVMAELKRHSCNDDKILSLLMRIQVDIGQLKIKAGVWGLVAGMIPSTALIIWFVTRS